MGGFLKRKDLEPSLMGAAQSGIILRPECERSTFPCVFESTLVGARATACRMFRRTGKGSRTPVRLVLAPALCDGQQDIRIRLRVSDREYCSTAVPEHQ